MLWLAFLLLDENEVDDCTANTQHNRNKTPLERIEDNIESLIGDNGSMMPKTKDWCDVDSLDLSSSFHRRVSWLVCVFLDWPATHIHQT